MKRNLIKAILIITMGIALISCKFSDEQIYTVRYEAELTTSNDKMIVTFLDGKNSNKISKEVMSPFKYEFKATKGTFCYLSAKTINNKSDVYVKIFVDDNIKSQNKKNEKAITQAVCRKNWSPFYNIFKILTLAMYVP